MATLRLPITFNQFSSYVAGTLTVRWFDSNAVSAVTNFASGTSGITGNTLSTSAATFTVTFASTSASGSVVDLATAFNGSTGLGLTVPDDYNKNITVEVEIDANVGATSAAANLTPLKKTIRHQILGVSDSTFTSSPATVQHNETEATAGTTKSLGTYSINDADSGANYTVNITYDKTIGSITYNNTSFLNTSASDKDVLTTTNVTNLNSVLGNLLYKPLFIASPGTNQNALQGQTITISISSDKDNKIANGSVTVSPTIDNTLQFSKSGSAPSFTENEGSGFDATGKSLGTLAISPSLTIPGVTFTATVTYDKSKGAITYPDASIVTTFGDRDEISTTNIATLNTALSSCTYVPTSIASGEDLENISADTISVAITTSPSLAITNPTTTVTTTVTTESEISGDATFTYVENTTTDNILSSLQVTDTADGSSGTNEVLAILLKPATGRSFSFVESSAQSNVVAYQSAGADHSNIPSDALIIQGFKANLNTWLTNNVIKYHPLAEDTGTDTMTIDVYRAAHGTTYNSNITQVSNFNNFKKIHQGNPINITNAGTVTTLALQDPSLSAMNYNGGTNAINSETLVSATNWGAIDNMSNVLPNPRIRFVSPESSNMTLEVSVNSSLNGTEFGNIQLLNSEFNIDNSYLTNSYNPSTQKLTVTPAKQGQHNKGGDAGINTLTHQYFQEETIMHNLGDLSAVSDEQQVQLTYTAKTLDGAISESLSIPYLIVKNGSTAGTMTYTGSPFENDNEFAIGMWVYLKDTELTEQGDTNSTHIGGANGGMTLFTSGSQSATSGSYYIRASVLRTGQTNAVSGQPAVHFKQEMIWNISYVEDDGTQKGFFSQTPFTPALDTILRGNAWNHFVFGANFSQRDFEFAVNGKGFSCASNTISFPSSFPAGLSNHTDLTFPTVNSSAVSNGRGHIQIHNDFEAGDIAGVGGFMGPVGNRFVNYQATPSSQKRVITPSVRTDFHCFLNGNETSWRARGNAGGSVSANASTTPQGNISGTISAV